MHQKMPHHISPNLCHTQFNQISDECWCATALIADNELLTKSLKSNSLLLNTQRLAVRQLLLKLLTYLNINDVGLNDLQQSSFPYQLMSNGWFVCFSHSQNHVAVAIHRIRPIGIDVETKPISTAVAKRFFNANEMNLITTLTASLNDPQFIESISQLIYKYLWQIKECVIKIAQLTLVPALNLSYQNLIAELLSIAKNQIALKHVDYNFFNTPIILHHTIDTNTMFNGVTKPQWPLRHTLFKHVTYQQSVLTPFIYKNMSYCFNQRLRYHIAILPSQQTLMIF